MSLSLSEMKSKNKEADRHFFDKGNSPVIAKYGNFLVTKDIDGDGYVVWKFNESNGHIDLVYNNQGEYYWQPYTTKQEAMTYAKKLSKGD